MRIGGLPPTSVAVVSSTRITLKTPLLPAGTLNDVAVMNPGSPIGTLPDGFLADFLDVPGSNLFHADIERVFRDGIAAGCGAGLFCPVSLVTRAQQAVFLLKGKFGEDYQPPPATGTVFADVPASAFAAAWIEALAAQGISGGCGGNKYCPNAPISRAQMAVLLLKAAHGSAYVPPAPTGIFPDVPPGSFAAAWIEQLYNEGITAGCTGGNYCPNAATPRQQMATFLVKTFGLAPAQATAPRKVGPRVRRP